jgi:hypothetical protein
MKTIGWKARLGALACLGVMAMVCMAAGSCNGSELRKSEQAAAGIAATLNTAATVNHNDAFETPEERQAIASYIVQVAAANDNFLGVLKAAEAQGGQVNIPLLEAAFSKLLNTVDALNSQGILKLKSPQAQADFALVMSSIQASLAAIETIYPPATSKNEQNRRHPWIPVLAIALTPAEVEELIALVVAAGSALVPKIMALRGETDAELIASAAADDASAEAIAESDGAAKPGS